MGGVSWGKDDADVQHVYRKPCKWWDTWAINWCKISAISRNLCWKHQVNLDLTDLTFIDQVCRQWNLEHGQQWLRNKRDRQQRQLLSWREEHSGKFPLKLSRKPFFLYPYFDLFFQNNCWIEWWSSTSIHIQSGSFGRQANQSFLKPCLLAGSWLCGSFKKYTSLPSFPKQRFQWKHTITPPEISIGYSQNESKSKDIYFRTTWFLCSHRCVQSQTLEVGFYTLKFGGPKKLPQKGFFRKFPKLKTSKKHRILYGGCLSGGHQARWRSRGMEQAWDRLQRNGLEMFVYDDLRTACTTIEDTSKYISELFYHTKKAKHQKLPMFSGKAIYVRFLW